MEEKKKIKINPDNDKKNDPELTKTEDVELKEWTDEKPTKDLQVFTE